VHGYRTSRRVRQARPMSDIDIRQRHLFLSHSYAVLIHINILITSDSLYFFVVLVTSSLRVKPRQALYLVGSVLIDKLPYPFLHTYADTSLVPPDPWLPTVAHFESHVYQRVLHTSFPSLLSSSSPPAAYRQELHPAVSNEPHESTIFDYMSSRRV
jgi:hypothetical protein